MPHQGDGRALLVGSPGKNLQGVEWDVCAMAEMLQKRHFSIHILFDAEATRDAILAGYDKLIHDVRPAEPAVFYYAGHGFLGYSDTEPTRSWQGIYPADKDATTTDDFRGITAWELSLKQAQLTRRTKNVTTILDCCYASQMSRDAAAHEARARALPHPIRRGFSAHLEALRAMYPEVFGTLGPTGNLDAVRLVACGQNECAYEYRGADGRYRGAFTEALLQVLNEVEGVPVSWASIIGSVQARVNRRFTIQHPGVEGPRRRRSFSLEQDEASGGVPILSAADDCRLLAGQTAGVAIGDVYGVMPSGASRYWPDVAVAELEVRSTSGTLATAVVRQWKNGCSALPPGATAFPIEKRAVRHAVTIDAAGATRSMIERAVDQTSTLRLAEPGELVALPTIRVTGDALTLEDRMGPLFRRARLRDHLDAMIRTLVNLGAAHDLRGLQGEHGVSTRELQIELGAVDHGELRPLPSHGSSLALGDRLYVRIVSKAQRALYIHLFNIGLRGRIASLTCDTVTGIRLTPERPEFVLGTSPEGEITGCGLQWPPGMPRDMPRTDEIVVIATAMATNLQALETTEHVITERGDGATFQGLRTRLCAKRNAEAHDAQAFDGFLVQRLTYHLHPHDGIMADLPFAIDDNPLRQNAARSPERWHIQHDDTEDGSRRLPFAVRFSDFVIKDMAPPSSLIRIDLLVTTHSGSDVRYAALTRRCRDVTAGRPLTLGEELALCDVARDFVELHLWLSVETGCPDLVELLARQRERNAARRAPGATAAATTGVAAAGAAAVLARTAYGALREACGTTLGLYRTCLTTRDDLAPPNAGTWHTPEVSFIASIAVGEAAFHPI